MKTAQIQPEEAKCIVCQEVITNPICPECMKKQIRGWHPSLGKSLVVPKSETGVRCLFCGKYMGVCAHCYSEEVDDLIGRKRPKLQEEFRELFGLRREAQI